MIDIGLERIALFGRIWLEGYFKIRVRGTEETELVPKTGDLHLYVRNTSGPTRLYYRDDEGVEYQLLAGASGSTTSIASGRQAVAAADTEAVVTRGFDNPLVIIMSLNTTWNANGP